jgi:TetR/AcrR family transcriptional regulator, transcriptional repressor for nem operon
MMAAMNTASYEKILITAESLIQQVGYNAFSYKDIAQIVGIKTSSIHYYFPTKADLGKQVVMKHIETLCQTLDSILNSSISYKKKLGAFFDTVIAKTYDAERKMCLGGILAAEILTLPESLQLEVRAFFKRIEKCLVSLLKNAQASGEFRFQADPQKLAKLAIVMLEGALLLARLYQNADSLALVKQHMLVMVEA